MLCKNIFFLLIHKTMSGDYGSYAPFQTIKRDRAYDEPDTQQEIDTINIPAIEKSPLGLATLPKEPSTQERAEANMLRSSLKALLYNAVPEKKEFIKLQHDALQALQQVRKMCEKCPDIVIDQKILAITHPDMRDNEECWSADPNHPGIPKAKCAVPGYMYTADDTKQYVKSGKKWKRAPEDIDQWKRCGEDCSGCEYCKK